MKKNFLFLLAILILASCTREIPRADQPKIEPVICWQTEDDFFDVDSSYNGLRIILNLPVVDWETFVFLDDGIADVYSRSTIDTTEERNEFFAMGFDSVSLWNLNYPTEVPVENDFILTLFFGKDTVRVWGNQCFVCL